jgi:hypothetical protein
MDVMYRLPKYITQVRFSWCVPSSYRGCNIGVARILVCVLPV